MRDSCLPAIARGGAALAFAAGSTVLAGATEQAKHEDFDASRFGNPTSMTNEWFAFEPGRQWVWDGTTVDDEGDVLPHRVVITATNLTKEIGGIRCVVTHDLDYEEDELVEAEVAFFAQDDEGNVWRMGEYPEEYDEGNIEAAPAWIHGIDGAVSGLTMWADPQLGSRSFAEGWAPGVDFTDRGRVREFVAEDCVPVDCYKNVLVIEENSASEPEAFQLKYWAKGVGNTRVGWAGTEGSQESLELVSVEMLDEKALAKVHDEAMKLEKSAYEMSKDVYGKTSPMELRGE
jgi:hypothetical protein